MRLGLQFAGAQDLHAVPRMGDDAGLQQALDRDRFGGVELAGVDGALDPPEIDLVVDCLPGRGEAAFWQPPMQRHLAALEALDAHARARGLALAAAPGLLALARTGAARHSNAGLRGARIVSNLVELHGAILYSPSTTRTRCATLAIMPRAAGGSIALARPPIRVWPT